MLDPITVATAAGLSALLHQIIEHAPRTVGELATHVGGGILHEKLHDIERHIRERIPSLSGLPANHDVRRAVRLAQLQALEYVLKEYEKWNPPEWRADPVNKPKWFLEKAFSFVRSQRPLVREIEFDGEPKRTTAVNATQKTIAQALASTTPSQRDRRLRKLAEDAVLDELRLHLGQRSPGQGIVLPDDFKLRFCGEAPSATRFE
jgi:hypothetical protein